MQKIVVETIVEAPIALVWDTFTEPNHVTHWYFASDDWHCPSAENDLKVGGEFHFQMSAKDGSFGFDFCGIYDVVDHHKHFTYHLADGRVIHVDFEEVEGGTKVTEQFDPENQNPPEMQQTGWQMILNNFKKYTESL
jgi:uncharacterized protein YndB with AHSA1/START domain